MGYFYSVRGWLEINEEMELPLRQLIDLARDKNYGVEIALDKVEFYLKGWIIPESYVNWTKYVFYGADVRFDGVRFLKEHLKEIAENIYSIDGEYTDYVAGLFAIDDEDNRTSLFWKLQKGKLIEIDRHQELNTEN